MFNLFKRTALKRTIFFVLADAISVAFSVWLAFLIRFDGQIPSQYEYFIIRMTVLAIVFIIPVFYFSKLYSFSWSYVSASDAISLFRATTISFLFLGIAIYISKYFPRFENFPRSTIFVSYALTFIFCGALRLSKRIYLQIMNSGKLTQEEKTLIVGAGDAGEQILRNLKLQKSSSLGIAGFVDDNPMKQGVLIHGFKVFGKINNIPEIVKKNRVEQIIIALPTAGAKTIANAVDLCRKAGVKKIKIVPHIKEIIGGEVSLRMLKDVDAFDLLGRDPINIEMREIENFIKEKVVLITGASGSIGSELSRQTVKFKPSILLLLDQDETGIFNIANELKGKFPGQKIVSFVADIRDADKINEIFKKFLPKIIFHAAAYKHVPLMEEEPDEAVKNNIFGTENLAKASLANHAENFIMISTDKAVNPTSVMGATKRVCEMICQAYNQKNSTKFISVRFGNVLDSRGSVIPIFREQIKRGGPVEVTHPDMKRYFMLNSEACLLVMQAGAMGKGGEVFVLDMGQPVKILDLAKEMIKLSGLEPDKDVAIVFSGIRPGEKLFEEILTAEEGTAATKSRKIFTANVLKADPAVLEKRMQTIREAVLKGDGNAIIEKLLEIVPSYRR